MIPEDHRVQNIAMLLIALALTCIGMGEWLHYAQLVGFALTVGGGGLGILTGQRLQQVNKTETGSINAPQTSASDKPALS